MAPWPSFQRKCRRSVGYGYEVEPLLAQYLSRRHGGQDEKVRKSIICFNNHDSAISPENEDDFTLRVAHLFFNSENLIRKFECESCIILNISFMNAFQKKCKHNSIKSFQAFYLIYNAGCQFKKLKIEIL